MGTQLANRSYMLSRARFLVRAEYNVSAIDLRLHGESGGRYITPGYLEAQDILGAIHYLREHGQRAPAFVNRFPYEVALYPDQGVAFVERLGVDVPLDSGIRSEWTEDRRKH